MAHTHRVIGGVFIGAIVALGAIGLVPYRGEWMPVSPQRIIEIIVVLYVFLLSRAFSLKAVSISIFSIVYVVVSYVYAVSLNNHNYLDFIQAYKAYIYLIFIPFLVNKSLITSSNVDKTLKVLLVIFFIKYVYSVLLGQDDRPIVYRENNYELMFLILLFYLHSFLYKRVSLFWTTLLVIVVFVSGSRSAVVLLGFVLFIAHIDKLKLRNLPYYMVVVLVLAFGAYLIYQARLGGRGVESIDRIRFLMLFLSEVSDWNVVDYFLGAERIARLAPNTCLSLSYYETLFSFSGDNSCYSVIFHSFILRVIFDHGILGFLFILWAVYSAMRIKGYPLRAILAFLGVVFLNGFSVSSFNSVFYMLALVLYLTVNNEEIYLANLGLNGKNCNLLISKYTPLNGRLSS